MPFHCMRVYCNIVVRISTNKKSDMDVYTYDYYVIHKIVF